MYMTNCATEKGSPFCAVYAFNVSSRMMGERIAQWFPDQLGVDPSGVGQPFFMHNSMAHDFVRHRLWITHKPLGSQYNCWGTVHVVDVPSGVQFDVKLPDGFPCFFDAVYDDKQDLILGLLSADLETGNGVRLVALDPNNGKLVAANSILGGLIPSSSPPSQVCSVSPAGTYYVSMAEVNGPFVSALFVSNISMNSFGRRITTGVEPRGIINMVARRTPSGFSADFHGLFAWEDDFPADQFSRSRMVEWSFADGQFETAGPVFPRPPYPAAEEAGVAFCEPGVTADISSTCGFFSAFHIARTTADNFVMNSLGTHWEVQTQAGPDVPLLVDRKFFYPDENDPYPDIHLRMPVHYDADYSYFF